MQSWVGIVSRTRTHYYNCEVDQLEIEFCVKVNLESSKERKKPENIIQTKSCLSCPFERQSDYQARNLDSSHSLKRYLPSLNAGHLDNDILVCPKGGLFLSLGPCCLDREAVFKWADRWMAKLVFKEFNNCSTLPTPHSKGSATISEKETSNNCSTSNRETKDSFVQACPICKNWPRWRI